MAISHNSLDFTDVLATLIEKFLDNSINLSPNPIYSADGSIRHQGLDNHGMGTIFEELVRRFNEENNEEKDGGNNEGNDAELPDDTDVKDDNGNEMNDDSDPQVTCKPDSCNGNGNCSVVGGEIECACDDGYAGDDCSECADGYYPESGNCVEAVSCTPDPCNGGGECVESDNSIVCVCDDEYSGEWCGNCADGYLRSNVDDKCKPDCETGNITCTGNMVCKINADTNEAGCDCKDGYFGTNCLQCDPDIFCSSKGTCYVSNNIATCECNTGYGGVDCSTCASGYKDFNSDGICYEDCDSSCGQSGGLFSTESHGECIFDGSKAECVCDQGWKDPILIWPPMSPECSECKKSDPPPEHSTDGCPASCKDSDGNYDLCGSKGKCYYEIEGSNKRYCKCNSGYNLDNGDPYTGFCE